MVPTDAKREVVDFGDFFISGGLTAVMYRSVKVVLSNPERKLKHQ
jgi:hypothetical protein